MPAPGALHIGKPVTVAVGTSVVLPRSGQLLGFFATQTSTVTLYDANSTTGLPTAVLPTTGNLGPGWS